MRASYETILNLGNRHHRKFTNHGQFARCARERKPDSPPDRESP